MRRCTIRRLAAGVALAAVAASGTAAAAAPERLPAGFERYAATSRAFVATDGARLVAFVDGDAVEVRDDADGRRWRVRPPVACDLDGGSIAVGSGQLVVVCGVTGPHQLSQIGATLRYDLAAGSWHEIPQRGRWTGASGVANVVSVGTRWMAVTGQVTMLYVDWRSGDLREGMESRWTGPDLDGESPERALCEPLWRPGAPVWAWPGLFLYDGGLTVADVLGASQNDRPTLLVQRCGERDPTVIAHSADSVSLGSGIVTGRAASVRSSTEVLFAHLASCRRTLEWPRSSGALAHTSGFLYLAVDGGLQRTALPRRCPALPRATFTSLAGRRLRTVVAIRRERAGAPAVVRTAPYGSPAPRLTLPARTFVVRLPAGVRRLSFATQGGGHVRVIRVGGSGRVWRVALSGHRRGEAVMTVRRPGGETQRYSLLVTSPR